jgi:hypothetical protein
MQSFMCERAADTEPGHLRRLVAMFQPAELLLQSMADSSPQPLPAQTRGPFCTANLARL